MKRISSFVCLFIVLSMILSLFSCSMLGGASGSAGDSSYGDGYIGGAMGDTGPSEAPDADIGDMGAMGPSGDKGPSMDGTIDGDSSADIPESVEPEGGESEEGGDDSTDDLPEEKPEENVTLPAGMITAGAWNDNDNYSAWLDLFNQGESKNGKFYNYTNPGYSVGYNSLNRVMVSVVNGENPIAGATVTASDEQGNPLFTAVSDANGNAYLFTDAARGIITVTNGDEIVNTSFTAQGGLVKVELSSTDKKLDVIELMFVVDVTGSMGDEISFLKAEIADVINRISSDNSNAKINLALLFYRDNGDRVPFDYYDFTDVTNALGLLAQQTALNLQSASGGGDYPEAVDEALEMAVNKQWSTGSTTKMIFHVLDAPTHDGEEYNKRLVNATKTAAEKGIRICPIICSGAAEKTEYIMREAAIYTGGTFIFVTDDSGIGDSHHDPELPNVTVELLNSLMVRLVNGYHTGDFAEPIFWKQDPNLNNK